MASEAIAVLGVDPGVTTGLAILAWEPGKPWQCIRRWEVRPEAESRGRQLLALEEELRGGLLTAQAHGEATIAMEEMLSFRTHSADEKVEAQAVVKLLAARLGVELHTHAPATIRSVVCQQGRADDATIRNTIRFLLRMPKRARPGEALSPHQIDAVCVALCELVMGKGMTVLGQCEEVAA